MILQTKCLESAEGHKFMTFYDDFPHQVRKYLQNCEYNICPACIRVWGNRLESLSYEKALIAAIKSLEKQIKQEEKSKC